MATILIIDDDPDTLSILETFLQSRGHDAHGAQSGPDGLELLDEIHPEVVLLDVMMPEMDGWEVARRIRKRRTPAETRIVMLTARDGERDRQKSVVVGADAYLVKPVSLETVVDRITTLIP